ncbi:phage head closure protein [Methylocystis heyeri]|uniref:Phage head closure protein n=1 Tax=Methylocystis heyeri TaxID=391905 RepID=A0A6B8KGA5_9HYPH|nr:phage head closure protein [Methylocystis heyeri]QGM46662.1 phage head closure protein [Methylocystis heyeri]
MTAFIRSGSMDRNIVIEACTRTQDDAGAEIETWAPVLPPCRAQLVQNSTKEFLRDFGAEYVENVVFRIRWTNVVTLDNRVTYDGLHYDIKELAEIGRRKGLELRCVVHK